MSGASMRRRGADYWRAGQTAAVESTIALVAGLALLFGSLRICLWFTQRYVLRLKAYNCTRVAAGTQTRLLPETLGWTFPHEGQPRPRQRLQLQPPLMPRVWDGPSQKLDMFGPVTIAQQGHCPSLLDLEGTSATYDAL